MNDDDPHQLFDWKTKVYLRVIGRNSDGLTVQDPRTDKPKRISWGKIGSDKRYRPS